MVCEQKVREKSRERKQKRKVVLRIICVCRKSMRNHLYLGVQQYTILYFKGLSSCFVEVKCAPYIWYTQTSSRPLFLFLFIYDELEPQKWIRIRMCFFVCIFIMNTWLTLSLMAVCYMIEKYFRIMYIITIDFSEDVRCKLMAVDRTNGLFNALYVLYYVYFAIMAFDCWNF